MPLFMPARMPVVHSEFSENLGVSNIWCAVSFIQAEAKRQSLAVRLTTIAAAIPHPRLNRKIADTYLGQLWDSLAPRYVEKPEALGPPDLEVLSERSWNIAPRHKTQSARSRS
jgi:hypothetical protein